MAKILSSKIKNRSNLLCKVYDFHGNLEIDNGGWYSSKTTNMSAATYLNIVNFVPNKSLDIALLSNGQKCKLYNFNIHLY